MHSGVRSPPSQPDATAEIVTQVPNSDVASVITIRKSHRYTIKQLISFFIFHNLLECYNQYMSQISKLIARCQSGIVAIRFYVDNNLVSTGSGFLYQGCLVSNNHVFNPFGQPMGSDTRVGFRFGDTNQYGCDDFSIKYSDLNVITGSEENSHDFIVHRLPDGVDVSSRFNFELDHTLAYNGQKVLILGYPFSSKFMASHIGYISAIYDRSTVELARSKVKSFMNFYQEWFKIMPDETPDSPRSSFNLNWIYMLMVGSDLVDRYENREGYIQKMMAEDRQKDDQLLSARLSFEPICQHCGNSGLRIVSKDLMNREGDKSHEVLFMLRCPHCDKNSAYWEDGSGWEHRHTYCPKCNSVMNEKSARKDKVINITYTCPSCEHSYKDKLDLNIKEKEIDPDYETDRITFCLLDKKTREEHIDGKRRLEGMVKWGKELKEREENKDIYDAVKEMKKPKIAELATILEPVLEKASYIEFSLDKPEIGKDVVVGFNCLDGKSDRSDYDSQKMLKGIVTKALEVTNWRLMSDGVSYRLGYLNGRLRAYEREEDLKALVTKKKKVTV